MSGMIAAVAVIWLKNRRIPSEFVGWTASPGVATLISTVMLGFAPRLPGKEEGMALQIVTLRA